MSASAQLWDDSVLQPLRIPGRPHAWITLWVETVTARLQVEQVVRQHLSSVWRVLRRAGVAEADCDDLCQEVFCIYADKLASVDAGAERAFAIGIALRKAADYRKARARRLRMVSDAEMPDVAAELASPDVVLQTRQKVELLDRLLTHMKDEYREVFVLIELEQLSLKEASTLLGVKEGTISSRLHRGRQQFAAAVRRVHAVEATGANSRAEQSKRRTAG